MLHITVKNFEIFGLGSVLHEIDAFFLEPCAKKFFIGLDCILLTDSVLGNSELLQNRLFIQHFRRQVSILG